MEKVLALIPTIRNFRIVQITHRIATHGLFVLARVFACYCIKSRFYVSLFRSSRVILLGTLLSFSGRMNILRLFSDYRESTYWIGRLIPLPLKFFRVSWKYLELATLPQSFHVFDKVLANFILKSCSDRSIATYSCKCSFTTSQDLRGAAMMSVVTVARHCLWKISGSGSKN